MANHIKGCSLVSIRKISRGWHKQLLLALCQVRKPMQTQIPILSGFTKESNKSICTKLPFLVQQMLLLASKAKTTCLQQAF